jgi:Inner centromere protein, ARK binding region
VSSTNFANSADRIRTLVHNTIDLTTPSAQPPKRQHEVSVATIQPTIVPTPQPSLIATIISKPYSQTDDEYVNYEMTDGEYDSDDSDECEQREKKRVPNWARSKNLLKALETQYSTDYPIDPDDLFLEVETCDLEAIFERKTSRYRTRNSSGDWTKDGLTAEEKLQYKLLIQ